MSFDLHNFSSQHAFEVFFFKSEAFLVSRFRLIIVIIMLSVLFALYHLFVILLTKAFNFLKVFFPGQFIAVWGFVYAFPQLCDHTALGLLVLLTLYFFFVVCRSRDQLAEPRPVDRQIGVSASSDR